MPNAVHYNTNREYIMKHRKKYTFKEKGTGFSGFVGIGILWVFPQVSLWVRDETALQFFLGEGLLSANAPK